MKSRTKKRIFKIGMQPHWHVRLPAGIFLQTTAVSVQAATNSMPGIEHHCQGQFHRETLPHSGVDGQQRKCRNRILCIPGQEPFVKLYTYTAADGNVIHFSTLEEGLSQLPKRNEKNLP